MDNIKINLFFVFTRTVGSGAIQNVARIDYLHTKKN